MASYPSAIDPNIDGTFSWQNKVNLQHYLQNVGAYSKNRETDGVWGYWTTLAIQTHLRAKRFPDGTRYYPGALDGELGPMTKSAMGDAAGYLLQITGKPNYMYGKCAGYSCTIGWANTNVVKQWQQWLNYNR